MNIHYPGFDQSVAGNGYRWWYVDAISDDQQHMLTFIAFIGSVFSPYYKYARGKSVKKGCRADPVNHCSVNVALYSASVNRWCMTERPHSNVDIQPNQLTIGPSSVSFVSIDEHRGKLIIDIDEIAAPLPRRINGRIEIDIVLQHNPPIALDTEGNHQWWPVGPNSEISVDLNTPQQDWKGHAYVDTNWGVCPIEDDIDYWCWSRYRRKQDTIIYYDVYERNDNENDTPDKEIAICISDNGSIKNLTPPPLHEIEKTKWQMPRHARSETTLPVVNRTMEDTPFYSRSLISSVIHGELVAGIHESVSLKRFRTKPVQLMLPFRMPRIKYRR